MNQSLASYRKNQIAGLNQKDLIVLLYSGAIKFLDQAKEELAKSDANAFADRIERAHRIVYHLYTTLDFEAGGEIAEKLGKLYAFVINQLYIVNSTRSEAVLRDIREILVNLKDGWQNLGTDIDQDSVSAVDNNRTENAAPALSVQV
jgi:flagellar protein FliS